MSPEEIKQKAEEIRRKLAAISPMPGDLQDLIVPEFFKSVMPQFIGLRNKGCSFEQITSWVQGAGFELTLEEVTMYYQEALHNKIEALHNKTEELIKRFAFLAAATMRNAFNIKLVTPPESRASYAARTELISVKEFGTEWRHDSDYPGFIVEVSVCGGRILWFKKQQICVLTRLVIDV